MTAFGRAPRRLAAGAAACLAALSAAACAEVESAAVEGYEPAHLEEIDGTAAKRVIFTAEGMRRTGLETERLQRTGGRTVAPYASLIYDATGKTFVYTSPAPRTFVRAEVDVDRISAGRALLADGPPPGTVVVTTGAAEVYGTELEIAGGH
jgi:hypothetical protein